MRILLVEDEEAITEFVKKGLSEEGYIVDTVDNGEDALNKIFDVDYDLIILDIMLPVKDGLKVCREVRENGISTPILMLTALDSTEDKVTGLNAGADDYLVKPFSFSELLARIRAILRRPPTILNLKLQVGDLVLDTVTHHVERSGKRVDLTPREYALLEFLMRHPNQVLSRTRIVEHVWNLDFYTESNIVDVYIRYLRKKIDNGFENKLIHTVHGVGYMIGEIQPNKSKGGES
ncbi:response regulator transcription factor [Kosmotoga sp.]|uniref:response regulator transcription factor n=1 Tax=Kosmotoga sp. TaxID=1955248 RepID=UPI0024AB6382|nr:response regulator transcription factor [Kosmotoga sp.]MDI3524463.1 hypothetical protein [Kosmotoga sp.]